MFERELGSTHLCSAFILYRSLTSTHLLPKYLFLLVNLLLTQFSIGEMFFHLLSPTTFCRNGEKTSDDCCSLFVAFADGRNRTLAACVASECSIHITIISQLFILLLNLNLCLEIPVLRIRPQHLRRGGVWGRQEQQRSSHHFGNSVGGPNLDPVVKSGSGEPRRRKHFRATSSEAATAAEQVELRPVEDSFGQALEVSTGRQQPGLWIAWDTATLVRISIGSFFGRGVV